MFIITIKITKIIIFYAVGCIEDVSNMSFAIAID